MTDIYILATVIIDFIPNDFKISSPWLLQIKTQDTPIYTHSSSEIVSRWWLGQHTITPTQVYQITKVTTQPIESIITST